MKLNSLEGFPSKKEHENYCEALDGDGHPRLVVSGDVLIEICDCGAKKVNEALEQIGNMEIEGVEEEILNEINTVLNNAKKCPCCDDVGWYVQQVAHDEHEQIQCEFCYTIEDSIFNSRIKLAKQLSQSLPKIIKICPADRKGK